MLHTSSLCSSFLTLHRRTPSGSASLSFQFQHRENLLSNSVKPGRDSLRGHRVLSCPPCHIRCFPTPKDGNCSLTIRCAPQFLPYLQLNKSLRPRIFSVRGKREAEESSGSSPLNLQARGRRAEVARRKSHLLGIWISVNTNDVCAIVRGGVE